MTEICPGKSVVCVQIETFPREYQSWTYTEIQVESGIFSLTKKESDKL